MNVMHLIGTSLPSEGLIGYVVIFRVINFTKNELHVLGMNWERFFLPTIRKVLVSDLKLSRFNLNLL